jgi:hypothetical protein
MAVPAPPRPRLPLLPRPALRDIRDDLRQRLASIEPERQRLKELLRTKLAGLDEYEAQLTGLLAIEEKRANGSTTPTDAAASPPPMPQEERDEEAQEEVEEVGDEEFEADLLKILDDGKTWEHARIKEAMEAIGWKANEGSLGRQIHGTLMAMRHRDLVALVGKGVWQKLLPRP